MAVTKPCKSGLQRIKELGIRFLGKHEAGEYSSNDIKPAVGFFCLVNMLINVRHDLASNLHFSFAFCFNYCKQSFEQAVITRFDDLFNYFSDATTSTKAFQLKIRAIWVIC